MERFLIYTDGPIYHHHRQHEPKENPRPAPGAKSDNWWPLCYDTLSTLRLGRFTMKKTILLLTATLVASASALAFTASQSVREVDTEVGQRIARGESLQSITNAAFAAGVPAGVLSAALVLKGNTQANAVTAMVTAGYVPLDVVKAAVTNGAPRAEMVRVAIAAGADPTTLTDATASGTGTDTAPLGGSFGSTQSATSGGGGSSSVSPS